ncbi:MAG: hypothetical protein RR313_01770 [Anaerovoracaceae bacterium]
MTKLIPLSRISKVDSVQKRKNIWGDKRNPKLLERCSREWDNNRSQREMRSRCKQYTYGDQWGDMVTYKGKQMTEKEYIKAQGNTPLVNNLIRGLVNKVVGVYGKNETEPVCTARDRREQKAGEMMTIALQCNWQINKMQELLTVGFEDFLNGAAIFMRETFEYRNDMMDSWTDMCNPNYMFFDSPMRDPRHWDLSMIGEIHDITLNELTSKFAKSPQDYEALVELYAEKENSQNGYINIYKKHDSSRLTFYTPVDNSLCRVFEVWTKEAKARYRCHDQLEGKLYKIELDEIENINLENKRRIEEGLKMGMPENEIPIIKTTYFIDSYWYYQFLTPNADILDEGETPYEHKSHPYSMKIYPFIDGEAHSFVCDVIDQQRYINRMITLNDFILRTGAKGVSFIDQEMIPDGWTPEEFSEQYTSIDGVIFYKAKPGITPPTQVYSNAKNLGISEIIQLQMQMMDDVSSVHSALQGKQPYSGTSAALYAQQTANSTTSLVNIFSRFTSFTEDVSIKKAKTIQQFYNEKRIINISGKNYEGVKLYDPEVTRDIQYDLSIKESASAPNYRMLANDQLMEFWEKGAITIEMLLENGDFKFADQLLQSLAVYKQEMQDTQQIPLIDPNIAGQVSDPANTENLDIAKSKLMK